MGDKYAYVDGTTLEWMASGHGGNKHAFITSKGVLFVTARYVTGIGFWRSVDNGDTWQYVGSLLQGTITCGAEYSIFCDELDNIHLTYAKWFGTASDGRTDKTHIMYMHTYMAANDVDFAGWSPEMTITGYDYWHCPDLVAHEHNGQIRVHILCNYNWAGDNRHITCYTRVLINNRDNANHVLEAQSFVHDVSGAQTYPGKVSVELRHNGDGKTPQTVNGYRYPDIIYTFTSSNLLHYGRIRWDGGNSWVSSELFNDTFWGNIPSASNTGTYGGLYEWHRWNKTLYSPRDNKCISIGWAGNPGFSRQGLVYYEWPIGSSTRDVLVELVGWPTSQPYGMISGSATLDPEGNVFSYATVNWIAGQGYCKVLRPKNSLTRTFAEHTTIESGGQTGDGARAVLLPYPQGEQHIFSMHSSNALIHWRTNRTCNYIKLGGSLVRRPEFRKKGSRLVPIQERRY